MPTFLGKAYNTYFKNILHINQSTNTGVDSTTRAVHDGAGNSTSISLSDDVLQAKPVNDNTTGTFVAQNSGGSNILAVDTTNSKVLAGASQTAVNTQYAHFGIHSNDSGFSTASADTHYAVPCTNTTSTLTALVGMGSSTSSSFNDTNPALSLTITTTAHNIAIMYWYVMDDITIDAVKWLHAADAATGDTTTAHLMGYDIDIDNGSTGGDLSSGVVLADGANISNSGYEQIFYESLTIQSADVDAGKVILFTFASDTVNSDYTINATVKYHIR